MSDIFDGVKTIKTKADVVAGQKVERFSYTNTAYASDNAAGVEVYDYANEQNIPASGHTDLADRILDKGLRSQASSMPRNGMNHFFGRVSYNLNKMVDWFTSFLSSFLRHYSRDGNRYSSLTSYQQYDECTFAEAGSPSVLRRFIRISSSPVELVGAAPVVGGVVNTTHWKELYAISEAVVGSTLPIRTAGGQVKVASPVAADDAATKSNVDNTVVQEVSAGTVSSLFQTGNRITVSTNAPSGGIDGDIWIRV